jgi:hypothetical protein
MMIIILAFGFVLWIMRLDQDDREATKAFAIIIQTLKQRQARKGAA